MAEAGSGDAFVVVATTEDALPWIGIIDGGPPGTPARTLRPILDDIFADAPLVTGVNLFVVTHVDQDHIGGAIDMLTDLRMGSLPFGIASVWHNSFESLTGDTRMSRHDSLRDLAAIYTDELDPETQKESLSIVASIAQGVKVADLLRDLGLDSNPPLGGLIAQSSDEVFWGDGPTITILGPTVAEIDALRTRWQQFVNEEHQEFVAAIQAVGAIDQSVTNLSSLVFLLEHEGQRVLFTGDARGDRIIADLDACGLLDDGHIDVNAFKIPHHGSERSCSQELFETVRADHYLISGDGTHDNPSPAMAARLIKSLHGRQVTVWMTHEILGVSDLLQDQPNVMVFVPGVDGTRVDVQL